MLAKLTYQHSGTEIKLVEELGDKDMVFHKTFNICLLNITNDICKPLVLFLCTCDPDEEHLYRNDKVIY